MIQEMQLIICINLQIDMKVKVVSLCFMEEKLGYCSSGCLAIVEQEGVRRIKEDV